jgi:hypothetical protein
VDLIAEDGKHFYSVDGSKTYLPGVTGILDCAAKHALLPWCAKVTAIYMADMVRKVQRLSIENESISPRLTEHFLDTLIRRAKKQPHFEKIKAGEIGTAAHALFEEHITGKIELAEGLGSMPTVLQSYLFWRKKEKLKVVGGDLKVASLKHGYGGSLDALLEDEHGTLVVADFKTSNYLFKSHAAQVASYSVALRETYGLKELPKGVIIRFDKEKVGYERREIPSISDSFKLFFGCLYLYEADKLEHFSNRETVRPEKVSKPKQNGLKTNEDAIVDPINPLEIA